MRDTRKCGSHKIISAVVSDVVGLAGLVEMVCWINTTPALSKTGSKSFPNVTLLLLLQVSRHISYIDQISM